MKIVLKAFFILLTGSASYANGQRNDLVQLPIDNGKQIEESYFDLKSGESVQVNYLISNVSENPFRLGTLETYYYNYVKAQNNCPDTLASGKSCEVVLTFTALGWGIVSGQGAKFVGGDANFTLEFYANILPN